MSTLKKAGLWGWPTVLAIAVLGMLGFFRLTIGERWLDRDGAFSVPNMALLLACLMPAIVALIGTRLWVRIVMLVVVLALAALDFDASGEASDPKGCDPCAAMAMLHFAVSLVLAPFAVLGICFLVADVMKRRARAKPP